MKILYYLCVSFCFFNIITEARYMSNSGTFDNAVRTIPSDDYNSQLCAPNNEWQEDSMNCKCDPSGMSKHCESHSYSSYQSIVPVTPGDSPCQKKGGCYSSRIKSSNLQTGLNVGQDAFDFNLGSHYNGQGQLCTPNRRWNEGTWRCNCSADGLARSCQSQSYRSYQSVSPMHQTSLGQSTEDIHTGRLVSNTHSGRTTYTAQPLGQSTEDIHTGRLVSNTHSGRTTYAAQPLANFNDVQTGQTGQRVYSIRTSQTTNEFNPNAPKLVDNLQSQLDQITNDFNSQRLTGNTHSGQTTYSVHATNYQTGQIRENQGSEKLLCSEGGLCQPVDQSVEKTSRLTNDLNTGRKVSTGTYKSGRTTFSNAHSDQLLTSSEPIRPLSNIDLSQKVTNKYESSQTTHSEPVGQICVPNSQWYEVNKLCRCRSDGMGRSCSWSSTSSQSNVYDSQLMSGQLCTPNSQWYEGIKLCQCHSDGMGRNCSWGSSTSDQTLYTNKLTNGQVCTPNTQWYEDKMLCRCEPDGMKRYCSWSSSSSSSSNLQSNSHSNSQSNIYNSDGGQALISSININGNNGGRMCTPNSQWNEGKMLCKCNTDGMGRHCSWSSSSYSDTSSYSTKPIDGHMCTPNSQWNEGPMTCTCNADGMGRKCSTGLMKYQSSCSTCYPSKNMF